MWGPWNAAPRLARIPAGSCDGVGMTNGAEVLELRNLIRYISWWESSPEGRMRSTDWRLRRAARLLLRHRKRTMCEYWSREALDSSAAIWSKR